MIGFNKLRDDFKAMNMSFYFLYRDISSVISQLLSSIWGFVTLIFKRGTNQGSLISLERSWIRVIKRFKCVFKRVIALFITLVIFIVSTPLFLIKLPLVWLGKLLDRIPLGDFGRDKEIRGLILTIISVFVIGIFCSAVVSVLTIYSEKLYQKDICFTDKCVTTFLTHFNSVSIILQSAAWLITLISTIGGIGIALMTYKTGVKNSNLTNHISHLNMFRDYVNAEISKRKFISPDKVNIYKWYSLIFPYSKKGDVSISLQYKN
ncbi:TPA: retron Ec48 family effector membrane protein, partial [Enterobacter kobei]|nr:retron Ec48 family effector membrane protein [Enterobacter kobei]